MNEPYTPARNRISLEPRRLAEISAVIMLATYDLEGGGTFPADDHIPVVARAIHEKTGYPYLQVFSVLKKALAPRLVPGMNAPRETSTDVFLDIPVTFIPDIYPVFFAVAYDQIANGPGAEFGMNRLRRIIDAYLVDATSKPVVSKSIGPEEFEEFAFLVAVQMFTDVFGPEITITIGGDGSRRISTAGPGPVEE